MTNDGQQVTNDDARSLAHHLRIAAEAPDVEQVFNKIYASYVAQAQLEVDRLLARALDPPGLLSRLRALFQRDKAVKKEETHDAAPKTPHIPLDKIAPSLRELADFCDGGRFVIR